MHTSDLHNHLTTGVKLGPHLTDEKTEGRGGYRTCPTATQVGKDSCHHQDMDLHIHLNQRPATPMEFSCVYLPSGASTRGTGAGGGTHLTSKPWRNGPSAASSPPHLRFRSLSPPPTPSFLRCFLPGAHQVAPPV